MGDGVSDGDRGFLAVAVAVIGLLSLVLLVSALVKLTWP